MRERDVCELCGCPIPCGCEMPSPMIRVAFLDEIGRLRDALEQAEAERDRLLVIVGAARALYEEVEMAESVGICLPNRVPSLNLGDALLAAGMEGEE